METTRTGMGKYRRIGQKVGNMVAIMLAVSIAISVAVCAYLFYSLMIRTLTNQSLNGSSYEASLEAAARGMGIVLLLALAIAVVEVVVCILLLAAYLKKTVSAPLAEITQAAARLEQGDLGLARGEEVRLTARSNDEIGELERMFV